MEQDNFTFYNNKVYVVLHKHTRQEYRGCRVILNPNPFGGQKTSLLAPVDNKVLHWGDVEIISYHINTLLWFKFIDDNYEKCEYEVKLKSGETFICWPNAGTMHVLKSLIGVNEKSVFTPEDVDSIREYDNEW